MNIAAHVGGCGAGCIVTSSQKNFSVYGDRTSYFVHNPNQRQVSKYIVDDCLLVHLQQDQKCDYLFMVNNGDNNDGYFVELKGGDVPQAIKQLISSVNHLINEIGGDLYGRIICSRFPKAPETRNSSTYLKLMKLLKGNLIIRSQQMNETV